MSVVTVTASSQFPAPKPAIDFDRAAFDRKVIQAVRHNLAELPLLLDLHPVAERGAVHGAAPGE